MMKFAAMHLDADTRRRFMLDSAEILTLTKAHYPARVRLWQFQFADERGNPVGWVWEDYLPPAWVAQVKAKYDRRETHE